MWQFVIASIWLIAVPLDASGGWSYTNPSTGPSKWAEEGYPAAAGTHQSPIDIVDSNVVLYPQLTGVNVFTDFTSMSGITQYTVENNGHSVQITFPSKTWYVSFLGDRTKQYEVVQMHFHWGANDSVGSEHQINGKSFSAEAHLVTYNCMLYPNNTVASSSPGGLAVLGFLMQNNGEQSDTFFGRLGNMLNNLPKLVDTSSSENMSAFNLSKVLELVDANQFYRYAGSLTTPPCTQNVMWTIFEKVSSISSSQLDLLRKLKYPSTESQTYMTNNYRPVQPVNPPNTALPRQVYRSLASRRETSWIVLLSLFALSKLSLYST
ncbi:unnamed protein product [Calicophoron daubneyi]|uniref:Carbonic anhydrase n=1 Tax=Calicophoron daubneyi TaxID=300641 RepID=A0AAV2TTL1_CALDB